MQIRKIHQFSFACNSGDGVTNSMFYIQSLLRDLGFESEIFSETIPEELRTQVKDISLLEDASDTLLFSHHCLGYDNWKWLLSLSMKKVMIYHNITPVELLPEDGDIRRWARLGREQLADWAPKFLGAIGVSQLNTQELIENRYAHVATIPMLVDFAKLSAHKADITGLHQYRDAFNVLFVGRICENKRQLELIEMIHHLRYRTSSPVRLILAGAVTSGAYQHLIEERIHQLCLQEHVVQLGKVSNEQLVALYRGADVFMCLSAHEGFGMPLIEAMQYKLPVIARQSSNIADTLGEGGILLSSHASAWDCANAAFNLMNEPALRRLVIQNQDKNLQRFSKDTVLAQLASYLQELKIVIPNPVQSQSSTTAPTIQIEGPFDTSYSLAVVNRELARALHQAGVDVGLRSHEGAGDFPPSPQFLALDKDVAQLHHRSVNTDLPPETALRFCYPPYLNDMPAGRRLVHSYGWEESGFPIPFVSEFNRRADAVTVLSATVGKTLRDAGVRVPIVVTGAGVDHLTSVEPIPLRPSITEHLREFCFLHISSCFPRKAVDVLLRAYGKSFRNTDPVTLVIKTFDNIHNTVAQDLARLQQEDTAFPHVLLVFEDLSDAELVSLYRASKVFVAPSRGEGLGLPMAEAMLFEVPVITSAWGGQLEFCDESTAWLCDYRFEKARSHLGLTHSMWIEPDEDHLVRLMQELYASTPQMIAAKTKRAKEKVLQFFTWSKTAHNISQVLDALDAAPVLRRQPMIGWISTWNSRCGIANYSHFLTEFFPQDRLRILANHVPERITHDEGNVIRCWSTGEKEHLDYLREEITEQQIDAVVIQYNFSFFSLKLLSELITCLKRDGKQVHLFLHSTADVTVPGHENTLTSILESLHLLDRIFVHGIDDVNRLKQWGLIANVCFYPHGIATPPLNSVSINGTANPETLTIASYGFLLPHKGILELIEAFSKLDHGQRSYRLLLLNALYPVSVSQELEAQCRALIDRLHLQEKVQFITDFLSDEETHRRLVAADLIVFPYQQTQESSSAAVRVGLATGKPVAVTPLTIFDDVAEAVFSLPGTTPDAIASGIVALLADTEAQQQKRLQTEQWMAERSWPHLSQRLINIIDGIANPLERYARNL